MSSCFRVNAYASACVFVSVSVCLYVCLSVGRSVGLSVCLCVSVCVCELFGNMHIRLCDQAVVNMSRVDTSPSRMDTSPCSEPNGCKDARTDEPMGSRISTSPASESSEERPRGRGNRGRGSRGRGARGTGKGKPEPLVCKSAGGDKGAHARSRANGDCESPRKKSKKYRNKTPLPDDRIPTSSVDDSSASEASSEVSRETARIRKAARVKSYKAYPVARAGKTKIGKRAAKADARKHREMASEDSPIEVEARAFCSTDSVPISSGVFDYVEWVINNRMRDGERNVLLRHSPVSIGSMCSGMGTEDLACHAIVNAMLRAGQYGFKTESIYKAESDVRKIAFLKRHRMSHTQIFSSNAALAQTEVENVDGQIVARPTSKILTAGIVCIDISSLSSTPQPVSGSGKSGASLQGLLESLGSMSLVERPVLVILECVPRLSQHRKVDPDDRSGAKYILDELSKLGYIGEWQTVNPSDYYLPQSRERVYGMFLLRDDFTEASTLRRQRDLEQAFQILRRMQVSKCEPLAQVLSRLPSQSTKSSTKRGQSMADAMMSGKKWPVHHKAWAESKGLSMEACVPPLDFVEQVRRLIPPRAMDALWLKLARMHAKYKLDWKQPLLVAPTGFSISYSQVWQHKFPCVTPGMEYLILDHGEARLANGLTMMAMQGIQNKEVQCYKLATEDDKLLRDLAGNAFTANIIAAFLIAGALVM
jgi:site-specific DNA-cytosine methylase